MTRHAVAPAGIGLVSAYYDSHPTLLILLAGRCALKPVRLRRAFAGFDPERVAAFGPAEVQRLLGDAGIVRNRLKIESAIGNARAYLDLQARHGRFAHWLWRHVDGRPIVNRFARLDEVPAETPLSRTLSLELKRAGFKFVGPTIVYAFMQAVGLVNDHLVTCPRHAECASMRPELT